MNWYLEKLNTVVLPLNEFTRSSLSSSSTFSNNQVEEKKTGTQIEENNLKNQHYPFFESMKISTITWKGNNQGANVIGETITPETKVNCYMEVYHIVIMIDFSESMNIIDPSSGKMYFKKMNEVVIGTLFNLNCSIQKNDNINKDSFVFNPKIYVTIIGCGLPDLANIGKFNEHV